MANHPDQPKNSARVIAPPDFKVSIALLNVIVATIRACTEPPKFIEIRDEKTGETVSINCRMIKLFAEIDDEDYCGCTWIQMITGEEYVLDITLEDFHNLLKG